LETPVVLVSIRDDRERLSTAQRFNKTVEMTDAVAAPSFRDVKRLLPLVLKRSGLALVCLHLTREMSLQFLNFLTSQVQAQGREDVATLVGLAGLNFLCEIMWSAVWSFVLISAVRSAMRDEPLWSPKSFSDFNQLLIEGVRSMAAVLYRLPFAVIPGLIELLRLLFVPHVVLLEPNYEQGHVDALERSREAIRQKWGLILLITLVSLGLNTLVDALTQGTPGETYFWQVPLVFLLSSVLTLSINLVYEIYLVALFLRLIMRLRDPLGDPLC
jgi:hypothetical protein